MPLSSPDWHRRLSLAAGLLLAAAGRAAPAAGPDPAPVLALDPGDRLLVLAPHPDDESIACGGLIQQAAARGIPVRVLFFTYGDNNQWSFALYRKHPVLKPERVEAMGRVRRGEALEAARRLGLGPNALVFLGYPDFGTLRIWNAHWGAAPPFRSMLTRTNAVPYPDAFRPGAAYTGDNILADLKAVLRDTRPTKVFLPHPADHNPDHRALFLFACVALWDLDDPLRPALFPYLVHYPAWPQPKRLAADVPFEPPAPLRATVAWTRLPLDSAQVSNKLSAIQAHASQFRYSGDYLASFVRSLEWFGAYPPIRLRAADAAPNTAGLDEQAEAPPEQLAPDERDDFTGVEWRAIRREDNTLVLAITLSRPLIQAVELAVSLCGYRRDRPFAAMPKLRIGVGRLACRLADQDRRLDGRLVAAERHGNTVTLRVPLEIAGNPDRLLLSARTTRAEVPLDCTPWRVVLLRE